jgi:PAS domain S-box-containing protein
MKWVLDKTSTAGFVVSVVTMLTVAGISWNQTRQLQEAAMWVSHTHQVLSKIENVRAGMSSLESSQRGYLLLGDEELLSSRPDAKDYVRNSISNLRTLTADNPDQKPRLDQLEPLVDQRTEFGERTILVRRQDGFSAAQQLLGTRIGIGLSNKIDHVLAEMREEEESLLAIRQKKADSVSTATFLVLPVGVFLSLTILALALFFLIAGFMERAEAEAALRESQGRFHSVMQNLTEGLVIADLEGHPLYWNPSIVKMLGFTTAEEANHKFRELSTFFDISMVDGSPLPTVEWPFARLLRGEVLRSLELQIARRDTDWKRIFSYNGSVVHHVGDKSLAFLTITDITERKVAEDASAQLAAIVNSSNDAIIGKDLNSIVTSWNAGAEKMFGYTADEMIGCSITRLIPADRQQEELSIITRVKKGECVAHFDTLRVAKDGHSIDISVTVSPIEDKMGKIIGASKVAKDITEHRRAQEALRESENQFRTMVNAIPQLAWIAHADGFIHWYNQRWLDYTGTRNICPRFWRDGSNRLPTVSRLKWSFHCVRPTDITVGS